MRERLYRSRTERMFLGVAGGLGEWFDVDPSFVRIAFVLLTVAGGAGILIYIAMAIIVPERPEGLAVRSGVTPGGESSLGETAPMRHRRDGRGAIVLGAILVIAGAWFLVRELVPAFDIDRWWPAVLILIGIVLLIGAMRGREEA